MNFDIKQFELSFYTLQQFIGRLLYLNFYLKKPLFFLLLFFGGILTGFNPCMLSMLPISLSYMATVNNYKLNYLSFILGLFSSFLLFILFFGILDYNYHNVFISLPVISDVIIVLIGLFLLKLLKLKLDIRFNSTSFSPISSLCINNYLLGFFLGLNTTSCSTPILFTLILILSVSNSYYFSALCLVVYFIGYTFLLLLLIFLIMRLRFIKNDLSVFSSRIFVQSSGFTLLSFGILEFLEKMFL